MRRSLAISQLPRELHIQDAVDAACAADLEFVGGRLRRGSSLLLECDKELSLYLYLSLRQRFRREQGAPRLILIDGRPRAGQEDAGAMRNMMFQLTEAVRGCVEQTVLVLPHLDVLATSGSSISIESRELIPLLYENPEVQLLAFQDPSFCLPKVIQEVFDARRTLAGIPREALPQIITQREARALDSERFDPFGLYKYVSGLNPARCRKLFQQLAQRREAPPGRSARRAIYRFIREQTTHEDVELPSVDLKRDIAGYGELKLRLQEEIIELLRHKESLREAEEIEALEALLPRGIIFHGPPGTGKTYFAKALATALDATIRIVSGPELKSKWVGESEENLRRLFRQARAMAPSVIVFDEIDSFTQHRGEAGSVVEHSMVNQLLTEMDGFRGNELLFVVGTTNLLESLDEALLRPGRFELLMEVPAPNLQEREAIIRLYDERMGLGLTEDLISHILRHSEHPEPLTGDHLQALCRALKRQQLRTGRPELKRGDIERALERRCGRAVVLSEREEQVVAIHEAGHALLAIMIPEATRPEQISISPKGGALGYVLRSARAQPYALNSADLRAEICVGLGGYVAEQLSLGRPSVGAQRDLRQATLIAEAMVLEYGMSPLGLMTERKRESPAHQARVDEAIEEILQEERRRAEEILKREQGAHQVLVERLLKEKILSGERFLGPISRQT